MCEPMSTRAALQAEVWRRVTVTVTVTFDDLDDANLRRLVESMRRFDKNGAPPASS